MIDNIDIKMIDISGLPYFSYGNIIDTLIGPAMRQSKLRLLNFTRRFPDQTRFMITPYKEFMCDYYARGFYQYGLFECDASAFESGFHMWDHLPCDPHGIYEHSRVVHKIGHGLTIVKQHGDYCDIFLFTTDVENISVNNFYLNHKDLFEQFIHDFYIKFDSEFDVLAQSKIFVPPREGAIVPQKINLSERQEQCARLLIDGLTTKEIAKNLNLSPYTINEYLQTIKTKYRARNRKHLLGVLNRQLYS